MKPNQRANDPARIKKLIQARDPSADPSVLASFLSEESDLLLRGTTMRNPNTPLNAMISQIVYFPKDFARNPALPLHLIEHPNLPLQLSTSALIALAALDDAPEIFFQIAFSQSKDPADLRKLLKPSRCSAEHLSSLYHSIEKRSKTEYSWQLPLAGWSELKQQIAAHPRADWPLLSEMLRREPHEIRELIIKRPLGDELTAAMLTHPSPLVRREALQRRLTPQQLQQLTKDEDKNIRAWAGVLISQSV